MRQLQNLFGALLLLVTGLTLCGCGNGDNPLEGIINNSESSVDVSGITLSKTTLNFTLGDEPVTLTATISPSNATDKTISWTSSDPSVATVVDGVVTPVGTGVATITAKSNSNNFITATCPMMVINDYSTAAIGDLFYSDGTFSSTLDASKTPIGVIAYLGKNEYTEDGKTLRDGPTLIGHGLVLCLKNADTGKKWSTEITEREFAAEDAVTDNTSLKRTTNVSGYENTKALAEKESADSKYPAAYYSWNYTTLTAPATTTGWFMASAQQWVKIISGLGGLVESSIIFCDTHITTTDYFDKSSPIVCSNWDTALSKVGAGNYDQMSYSGLRYYWTSSEYDNDEAVMLYATTDSNTPLRIYNSTKNVTGAGYLLRPILAF